MKISVWGSVLFGKRSGIGQYTKRLLEAMVKIDRLNKYTVLSFLFFGRKKLPIDQSGLNYHFIRIMPERLYNQLMKHLLAPPIDLLGWVRPDVMLFPNFIAFPTCFTKKKVLFIHDLSFITYGIYCKKNHRNYLERFVPKSIAKADGVVTISRHAKKEIVNFYQFPSEKVTIIYPGIDRSMFYPRSREEIQKVRDKFRLGNRYILFTGTLEPRKNITGILDAYASLPKEMQAEYQLVLAGGKGWADQKIKKKLASFSAYNISVLGYIPDEELPALYSGASLFVYPSFYEGFGMPPLEAMACGIPVITSGNSSLPEVVGEAAILIKAEDTEQLAAAMIEILKNPELAQSLSERGILQAKKFCWYKSAKELISYIDNL